MVPVGVKIVAGMAGKVASPRQKSVLIRTVDFIVGTRREASACSCLVVHTSNVIGNFKNG